MGAASNAMGEGALAGVELAALGEGALAGLGSEVLGRGTSMCWGLEWAVNPGGPFLGSSWLGVDAQGEGSMLIWAFSTERLRLCRKRGNRAACPPSCTE